MEKFFDALLESVIDTTRPDLDLRVFDKVEDEYHLKSYHKRQLIQIVQEINEVVPVENWYIKGSILSRQWLPWSDIDVLLEIDENISDEQWEQIRDQLDRKYTGIKLAGTDHPIEIFPNRGPYDQTRTEGLYDVENDEWIKGLYSVTVDVEEYMDQFQREALSFDIEIGQLKRNLMDYMTYQSLTEDEISALSDKIRDKIEQIDRDVEVVVRHGKAIRISRFKAFTAEMTPDELRKYGIKNKLPENVVAKMLERYRYMATYKALKEIRRMAGHPEKIDDPEEIEALKKQFDMPNINSL